MREKRIKILETVKEHILNNKKEYIIVSLIFIIRNIYRSAFCK